MRTDGVVVLPPGLHRCGGLPSGMKSMSHLPVIDWNYADRMKHANKNLGGGDVYFTYDGSGQRVRKVWLKAGNSIDERIYIGGWETFHQRTGSIRTPPTFEPRDAARDGRPAPRRNGRDQDYRPTAERALGLSGMKLPSQYTIPPDNMF